MPTEEGNAADAGLLERLRAGDLDAFVDVVRAWSPIMLQAARAYVSTDASAQEASRARRWLAHLPRRRLTPATAKRRLQFAELGSSVPAWSATAIPVCFSAQSSAKSATSSHPSMAGSRCGPSNSTISVTVLDL